MEILSDSFDTTEDSLLNDNIFDMNSSIDRLVGFQKLFLWLKIVHFLSL